MGMIGRWIDSLTDEQRDQIIEHPDPTYNGRQWWDYERNCGCLVGSVLGEKEASPILVDRFSPDEAKRWWDVGERFYRYANLFTPERMWRIVKARAAKNNAIPEDFKTHMREGGF